MSYASYAFQVVQHVHSQQHPEWLMLVHELNIHVDLSREKRGDRSHPNIFALFQAGLEGNPTPQQNQIYNHSPSLQVPQAVDFHMEARMARCLPGLQNPRARPKPSREFTAFSKANLCK